MHSEPSTIMAYGPPPGGYGGGPPPGGYGGGPPPGDNGGPPGGFGGPPPGGYGPPPMGPPPGGFGVPPPYGYGGPPMGPMMMPEPQKGLAIASLVCGILAIPTTCCCSALSLPLAVAAVVMGGIAISKANRSPQTHGGKGMAVGGLVTGICGVVFAIVMLAAGMGQYFIDAYGK